MSDAQRHDHEEDVELVGPRQLLDEVAHRQCSPSTRTLAGHQLGEICFGGHGRVKLPFDSSSLHQQDAVAVADDLRDVIGDDDDRHPLCGQVAQDLVDVVLRADVDADGGAVEDEDVRAGGQPLGKDDALLVAAGKGVGGVVRVRGGDLELFNPVGSPCAHPLAVEQTAPGDEAVDLGDDDVVADGTLEEEALGQSVLGDVADAVGDRVADAVKGDRFALHPDFARVAPVGAEERERELGAAGSEQAGDARGSRRDGA